MYQTPLPHYPCYTNPPTQIIHLTSRPLPFPSYTDNNNISFLPYYHPNPDTRHPSIIIITDTTYIAIQSYPILLLLFSLLHLPTVTTHTHLGCFITLDPIAGILLHSTQRCRIPTGIPSAGDPKRPTPQLAILSKTTTKPLHKTPQEKKKKNTKIELNMPNATYLLWFFLEWKCIEGIEGLREGRFSVENWEELSVVLFFVLLRGEGEREREGVGRTVCRFFLCGIGALDWFAILSRGRRRRRLMGDFAFWGWSLRFELCWSRKNNTNTNNCCRCCCCCYVHLIIWVWYVYIELCRVINTLFQENKTLRL